MDNLKITLEFARAFSAYVAPYHVHTPMHSHDLVDAALAVTHLDRGHFGDETEAALSSVEEIRTVLGRAPDMARRHLRDALDVAIEYAARHVADEAQQRVEAQEEKSAA